MCILRDQKTGADSVMVAVMPAQRLKRSPLPTWSHQYLNTLGNGFVILSFKKLEPELCLWWAFWIQSPRRSSWYLEDMEPVLAAVNSESEYSCLIRTPIRKKRMWVKSTLCCCWGRMMSPLLSSALVKPTVSLVFTSQCHSFRCL